MISFDDFKAEGDSPIYLQVIMHLKRGIAAGKVVDADPLPSRRVLSATLGINPNTVQKAYKLLEDEGLIVSKSGAGSEIVVSDEVMERIRKDLMENEVGNFVTAMKKMGSTKEETTKLVERMWGETEDET